MSVYEVSKIKSETNEFGRRRSKLIIRKNSKINAFQSTKENNNTGKKLIFCKDKQDNLSHMTKFRENTFSKFKNQPNLLFSSTEKQNKSIFNDILIEKSLSQSKSSSYVSKKPSPLINLSQFKINTSEENIKKNIQVGTNILKNFPIFETNSLKEKSSPISLLREKIFSPGLGLKLTESVVLHSDEVFGPISPFSSKMSCIKSPQPLEKKIFNRKPIIGANQTPLLKYIKKPNSHESNFKRKKSDVKRSNSIIEARKNLPKDLIKDRRHSNCRIGIGRHFTIVDENLEIRERILEIKSLKKLEYIQELEKLPDEDDMLHQKLLSENIKSFTRNIEENDEFISKYNNMKGILKPSKVLLQIGNRNDEHVVNFYNFLFSSCEKENYIIIIMSLMVFLYHSDLDYLELSRFDFIARSTIASVLAIIIKYFNQLFEKRILTKSLIITYVLLNFIILWPHIFSIRQFSSFEFSQILLLNIFFQNISLILFVDSLISSFLVLGFLLLFQIMTVFQFLVLSLIIVVNLYLTRDNYLRKIHKTNLNIANVLSKTQQKTMVRNLLPNHIIQQFINNPSSKSDLIEEFQDVTILFADIKGFTNFSAHHPVPVVANMLRDLFTELDRLCLKNEVYKLYTIGDCYVAMGLIDANLRNVEEEAKNVIEFAFQMLNMIKSVRKKYPELEMRIGIHIVFLFMFFILNNF